MSVTEKHVLMRRYADGFDGVIPLESLKYVGPVPPDHIGYRCPCGGMDHVATRRHSVQEEGSCSPSDVLNCYEHGRRWSIDTNAMRIIASEEESFGRLLDRHADKIGKKTSASESFRLYTEQGVPVELLDVDDQEEYDRLFMEHQRVSRATPEKQS